MSDSNLMPSEEDLRAAGVNDPARGMRLLAALCASSPVPDASSRFRTLLLDALRACPDPDRALVNMTRWREAAGESRETMERLLQPGALAAFCQVTGSSQYLADVLVRYPEFFDFAAVSHGRSARKAAPRLHHEISTLLREEADPTRHPVALRRWKAGEMLRIGSSDLLGVEAMPAAAREFSHLADVCAQIALDIAAAELPLAADPLPPPFTVIALGKLGGLELNYCSDIDLMFVHGDGLPARIRLADGGWMETSSYLTRLAERVVSVLGDDTAEGRLFRVDMRLRPEGRSGPLTRSLSGYSAYYEKWAENWERQALLKARVIAGDRALGEAFIALATRFVYGSPVSRAFLNSLRANKRRIELKCRRAGETYTNIKTGYGGIRDVEFLVQMLQLEFGGARPRLRTTNTLFAIQRLHYADLLTAREAQDLADDYRFLRTLEHRLQLLYGFQTQTLPPAENRTERGFLARRMGFATAETFEEELNRRRDRLHGYLESLFYAEDRPVELGYLAPNLTEEWAGLDVLIDSLDAPSLDAPASQARLGDRLAQAGFTEPAAAVRLFLLLRHGAEFRETPGEPSAAFKAIAPQLLHLLTHGPDPDAGLAGIEMLAVPNRDELYRLFLGNSEMMRRVVQLAAVPSLFKQLVRHQEWMEILLDPQDEGFETDDQVGADPDQELSDPLRSAHHVQDLTRRIRSVRGFEAQLKSIALFHQREMLRTGARDIWDEADAPAVMARLSRLAEAVLQILLDLCAERLATAHADPEFARRALSRVAVVGLGKLGGAELGYSSDWDLLFVYDELRGDDRLRDGEHGLVSALVEQVVEAVSGLVLRGAAIETDLRLRPWGRQGALIYSLRGYAAYYRTKADTWERQAALKARFVAGNVRVGLRFERILQAVSFGKRLTPDEDKAVRAMKGRIESERLKQLQQETDLKLGHGGLSDVEWLVQRLQLLHGADRSGVRVPNTLRALAALASERILDKAEADVLAAAYTLLTQVRNAMWLQAGAPRDVFPQESRHRRYIARLLGYTDTTLVRAEERLQEDIQSSMQDVRRIFSRRFLG